MLAQTGAIQTFVEDQTVSTQQIAQSVTTAFEGTGALCGSVELLGTTVEQARDATVEVVGTATRMVEEARRMNEAVKSFLAEVSA